MCVRSQAICSLFFFLLFFCLSAVKASEWFKVKSDVFTAHSDDFSERVNTDLAQGTKPGCYFEGDDGFNKASTE